MFLYCINMYMICSLPSRKMFTSKATQDRVAREVKSRQPEILYSLIKDVFAPGLTLLARGLKYAI